MVKETEYNRPWIVQRADPYVIKKDGLYYFTASYPAYDRILLRCAGTLDELADAQETEVWHKHETGMMSKNVWAPELHYLDGRWFLYFAAGEAQEQWKIRPYVLECEGQDPMKDAWVERGPMKAAKEDEFSFRAFSLDATIFESEGKRYYVWAEKVGVGKMISNLYIAEMASPYQLKTMQVLLTTPDYDWEREVFWVDEGPAVLKRNGNIYLTFSASGTGACYCVGMLCAKEGSDLLDPRSWEKFRYPVLQTDDEKGIYGPGHNSFTKSEDDKTDIMIVHYRQYKEIIGDSLFDPNRHAKRIEVEWDDNDLPVFAFRPDR